MGAKNITYTTGAEAANGGLDITISLTPDEFTALGHDAADLADHFDSVLWSLALLRTGRVPRRDGSPEIHPDDWYLVINSLGTRFIPRLQGILDAAIRAQAEVGTVSQLATAFDVPRSTAQARREKILARLVPSSFEQWATGKGTR